MDGGLEQPQIDEIEYLKLTDELKREMPDLLTDIKNPLDGFKKDEYEQAFLAYIKEHDDILREIEDVYVCSTNAKEGMQNRTKNQEKPLQRHYCRSGSRRFQRQICI